MLRIIGAKRNGANDRCLLCPWLLLPSFLSTLTFFEPYSINSKSDSCDKYTVSTSIIIMSEANSIAGTVGTWVGGFVVLLVSSLISAYIARSVTLSKTEKLDRALLVCIRKELGSLNGTEQAQLEVLLRLEKIALEVKNESGDVLVLQRVPRASAQVIGGNNPGRA